MKIKSTTDVITNSSSEIFTLRAPGKTKDEIQKIIEDFHKGTPESCTGMGGLIEVKDFQDRFEDWKADFPRTKQHLVTEEDYLKTSVYPDEMEKDCFKVDIDEGFEETILWVIENFEILDADGGPYHAIFDEKGEKIIEFTKDWEKWTSLPRIRTLGKYWCENYDKDQE